MARIPGSVSAGGQAPATAPLRGTVRPLFFFLLALVLIDRSAALARGTWERYSPDDYEVKLQGLKARPRDFVLAGGSPVNNGLVPSVLTGMQRRGRPLTEGFVIGLPGGTASDTYHAITKGCPTAPKLLVCGMTASCINDSRNQPHGPAALMDWDDVALWTRVRPNSAKWVTQKWAEGRVNRLSALFHFRHGIKMWAADQAERLLPGSCPRDAEEAHRELAYSQALRSEDCDAPNPALVERRFDLNREATLARPFPHLYKFRTGSHLQYVRRLLGWARSQDCEVVLVDMPVTEVLEKRYAAEYREFRERMAEIDQGYPDVKVLRADPKVIGLGEDHFADLVHLNRAGALKLSAWLRAQLEDMDR